MVSYSMLYGATHGFGQVIKDGPKLTEKEKEEYAKLSKRMDKALMKAIEEEF